MKGTKVYNINTRYFFKYYKKIQEFYNIMIFEYLYSKILKFK